MSVARERPEVYRSNTPLIVGAVLAALLLGGFGLWAFNRTRPEPAIVTQREIVPSVSIEGQTVAPPGERADITVPFEAPVERVLASVGQNVRKGEVLVELSYPASDASYEQARQAVRAAETAAANAAREYDAEVTAAKRAVDEARSAEQASRSAPPAAVTVTPPSEGEQGTAPLAAAPAAPAAPAADLSEATRNRILAEQTLAAAQERRDAALGPYRESLAMAREAFQRAQAGERATQVRTPVAGTVLTLNARSGETVKPDGKHPIATVVDLDELELQGPLPAATVSDVKPGKEGTMVAAEVPNEQFGVRVHSVVTTPGKLGRPAGYAVILHVKNKGGRVKPGMKARAAIHTGEPRTALAVPNHAVRTDGSGRPVVKVLRGGQWQEAVVEIGITDGRYTEIRSGLEEGETVQVKQELL